MRCGTEARGGAICIGFALCSQSLRKRWNFAPNAVQRSFACPEPHNELTSLGVEHPGIFLGVDVPRCFWTIHSSWASWVIFEE